MGSLLSKTFEISLISNVLAPSTIVLAPSTIVQAIKIFEIAQNFIVLAKKVFEIGFHPQTFL